MSKSELRELVVILTNKIDSLNHGNRILQESKSELSSKSSVLEQKNKNYEIEINRLNNLVSTNEIEITTLKIEIKTLTDSISNLKNTSNTINEVIVVDSTIAFKCKISEFPTISNQNLLHSIYSIMTINRDYWVFTDYSPKGLLEAINNHKLELTKDEDRKDIIERYNNEYGIAKYEMLDDISLSLFTMDENFITINYTFNGHRGGVGWYTKNFITFDKNSEQVIRINDILKTDRKGYEWSEILRKYAITQNNCLHDEPIPLSEIFYFNKESITFVYNKNEIACGADGIINITVPLNVIWDYFRDDFRKKYWIWEEDDLN